MPSGEVNAEAFRLVSRDRPPIPFISACLIARCCRNGLPISSIEMDELSLVPRMRRHVDFATAPPPSSDLLFSSGGALPGRVRCRRILVQI